MKSIFNEAIDVLKEASKEEPVRKEWSESVKISCGESGPVVIEGKKFRFEIRPDFDNSGVTTTSNARNGAGVAAKIGSKSFERKEVSATFGSGMNRAGKLVQLFRAGKKKTDNFSITLEGDFSPFDTPDWRKGSSREDRTIKAKSTTAKITYSGSSAEFENFS